MKILKTLKVGVIAGFVTLFENLKISSSRNPNNEARSKITKKPTRVGFFLFYKIQNRTPYAKSYANLQAKTHEK